MAITTGFQPVDRGSIPLTRSTQASLGPQNTSYFYEVFCFEKIVALFVRKNSHDRSFSGRARLDGAEGQD